MSAATAIAMKLSTHHCPPSCSSRMRATPARNGTYTCTNPPITASVSTSPYVRPSFATIWASRRQTMTNATETHSTTPLRPGPAHYAESTRKVAAINCGITSTRRPAARSARESS